MRWLLDIEIGMYQSAETKVTIAMELSLLLLLKLVVSEEEQQEEGGMRN